MSKYKEAFTYLFKEKNWGWKYAIPLISELVLIGIAILMSASQTGLRSSTVYTKGTYTAAALSTPFTALYLVITCIYYVVAIIVGAINMYYIYENTQAAIEKRETKGFWQYPSIITIKRMGKLFLTNLIYGIIPGIVVGAFVVVLVFAGVISGVGIAASNTAFNSASLASYGALFVIVLCCGIVFTLIFSFLWDFFVALPARLRLIETNTFGRAFDLHKNLSITKNNAGEILKLVLLNIVIVFVALAILIVSAFAIVIPILGWILFAVVLIVFMVFIVYYQQFVVPYMTGILWKNIKK